MKLLVGIALVLLAIGCSSEITRRPEPKNLIPKSEMILIVREMVKLESHIQAKYADVATYHKVMVQSGDSLLSSYNLTKGRFEASLDYYASRQELMEEIYAQALQDLNKELGELESKLDN
jgi:hypothetical protein